jgi:hypothetical protein
MLRKAFDYIKRVPGAFFHPPAELMKSDIGLTFTIILFGFVIRELFIRIQNWNSLQVPVRWQLVVGTALVLGSWIGFSQSDNRSRYKLKFFNLPTMRWVMDQSMVLLYFRLAVLTPTIPNPHTDVGGLVNDTLRTLVLIFVLYAFWDMFGIWMAKADTDSKPKYPLIRDDKTPKAVKVIGEDPNKTIEFTELHPPVIKRASRNWSGLAITLVALVAMYVIAELAHSRFDLFLAAPVPKLDEQTWNTFFIWAAVVLVAYRAVKEIRNTLGPRATAA